MLGEGIIKPVECTECAAPIVSVMKPNNMWHDNQPSYKARPISYFQDRRSSDIVGRREIIY